jgi:site-specific DNA-methyltransferase (adenine-specific)
MAAPATTLPSDLMGTPAGVRLDFGDAMGFYSEWDKPTVIVVDGPYGVAGYPGDPPTPRGLGDWYEPHVREWARYALPSTTLWFWNTEVGWANVHGVLEAHNWEYRSCYIWDKGIGHVAGNVNGNSIRRMPVVTEVCVQYVRNVQLQTPDGRWLPMKQWLHEEWKRSGLPLYKTNEAAGVANAATRKWFTQCHLWYFPPPDKLELIAAYANEYGQPTDRPYFSLDGATPLTADAWEPMRAKWNHIHGLTNVWSEPAVRGSERLKTGLKSLHGNQKPLKLMERIIAASSDAGDTVWDPFGGLATGAIASLNLDRRCQSAEINPEFYGLALERLVAYQADRDARLLRPT